MKKWILVLTIAAATVGSSLFGLVSQRLNPALSNGEVTLLIFSLSLFITFVGSTVLFIIGLKSFTTQSKMAYAVFCTGILLFALSELQIPVAAMLNMQGSNWLTSGVLLIPLLLALTAMYAGVRLLARLFGVGGMWARPWFVALVATGSSIAGFFTPVGPPVNDKVMEAHGTVSLMLIGCVIFIASTLLAHQAYRQATQAYRRALLWFTIALAGLTITTGITIVGTMTLGTAHWLLFNGYSILLQVIASLPLVWAAYEFNVIDVSIIRSTAPAHTGTMLDIVIAAAKRGSNLEALDPMLENVRRITATASPGESLTPEKQAALAATYRSLEEYLTQEDPVRRYTKEELRDSISKELGFTIDSLLR